MRKSSFGGLASVLGACALGLFPGRGNGQAENQDVPVNHLEYKEGSSQVVLRPPRLAPSPRLREGYFFANGYEYRGGFRDSFDRFQVSSGREMVFEIYPVEEDSPPLNVVWSNSFAYLISSQPIKGVPEVVNSKEIVEKIKKCFYIGNAFGNKDSRVYRLIDNFGHTNSYFDVILSENMGREVEEKSESSDNLVFDFSPDSRDEKKEDNRIRIGVRFDEKYDFPDGFAASLFIDWEADDNGKKIGSVLGYAKQIFLPRMEGVYGCYDWIALPPLLVADTKKSFLKIDRDPVSIEWRDIGPDGSENSVSASGTICYDSERRVFELINYRDKYELLIDKGREGNLELFISDKKRGIKQPVQIAGSSGDADPNGWASKK